MKTNMVEKVLGRAHLWALMALVAALAAGCLQGSEEPLEPEDSDSSAIVQTPVAAHGKLSVSGGRLKDEHGADVQLAGMSLFWSQWAGSFYNPTTVATLAGDFRAGVVRAAMGVEMGGYLQNPAVEKAKVKTVVDAAVAQGIYVIIDWHDHNATQHTSEAKAFFTEMAQAYGQTPNVIFEIYNEPVNVSWAQVKAYAEEVTGAIRGKGANNVVIVGTPNWSQDVDAAANNPITAYNNVAYTLHFYAGTHKQWLRDKASYAMGKGLALFVTEWGTCDASGNGGLDLAESQVWIDFLNQHHVSFANWSLFDKNETASALVPGASPTGPWADNALTASGKFVKQKIQSAAPSAPSPGVPGQLSGRIALRAAVDNQLVCAEAGGQKPLIANRSAALAWEQFDVIQNNDGTIALRAVANAKFVCAEDAGQKPLIANRNAVGLWEKFEVIDNGDGTISLRAKVNGKIVCAENAGQGELIANRTAVGLWEKFYVVTP